MFKKLLIKNWTLIFVNIVVIIFFAKLFFPLSTFTTPDFGRTDILHIALPDKLIQSEILRNFHFSFWENRAGFGYASLPENVGFFFIPNLIIFFLLPFNLAIPTTFLVTFLLAANTMYYLLIKLNLEKLSASFGAIAFVFSAAMLLRIPQMVVAQAICIVPLAIALNSIFLRKQDKKIGILFAIVLSQILVTFTQIYVYLILLLTLFNFLYLVIEKKGGLLKIALVYITIIIFSLILSSAQLFASYEGLKLSARSGGIEPESILSNFPLLPKNLLTFFDPFIVGKSSNGSYNSTNWGTNGIYWENTTYIGILPFIFSIFAILYTFRAKSKNIYKYLLIVTLVSLTLALGKLAPLHVLFSFPPLSFFRVPARFMLFTQIFLIIFAALGFDILLAKSNKIPRFVFPTLIFATILTFYIKWWNYHSTESLKTIEDKPELLKILDSQNTNDYMFYSIGQVKQWNDIFTKSGWENKEDYYKFFRNSLEPNLNIFYGFNHFSSYQILTSRRQGLQQSTISQNTTSKENLIEFKEPAKKAFNIYSIKWIVTTIPIKEDFEKIDEVTKDNYKYYLYENKGAIAKFHFYYNFESINYISDYIKAFENTDLSKTVLIENSPSFISQEGENTIKINKQSSTNYELDVSTTKQAILVLNDSYSKDWKAKIDGKQTIIYPANINSKSIIVPEGNHKITFYYQPIVIYVGMLVSVFSYLLSIKILLKKNQS